MSTPASRPRALAMFAVLGFVAAAALLLVTRIPLWIRVLALGLAIAALLGVARRMAATPGWEVDGEGVRGLHAGAIVGRVCWSELVAVSFVTRVRGRWSPEFFYALVGSDGQALMVPLERAATTSLLVRLGRLPGFDHRAVVRATGSTRSTEQLCWTGEPGEGEPAGGEIG